jgi:thiol-disulfide isomerase/thioredoxin
MVIRNLQKYAYLRLHEANVRRTSDLIFIPDRCAHCKQLSPIIDQIATELAARLVVAKCDATIERALAARFDVRSYPSVFHLSKKRDVRKYNGRRSFEELKDFVDGTWNSQSKMSMLSSPFGPIGRLKGFFIWAWSSGVRVYNSLVESGYSSTVAGLIVLSAGGLLVLAFVFMLATFGGEEGHEHAQ